MSPSMSDEHAAGGAAGEGWSGGAGGEGGVGTAGGDGGTRQKLHALHLHRPQLPAASLMHQPRQSS